MEEYRSIKGYEGLYEVSNKGTVRSVTRVACDGRQLQGRTLSQGVRGKYYGVTLYRDSKGKSFNTHQLVAIAFLDHTPKGHKIQVDHIDNDPKNNRLENLQLISHRENSSKDRKGTSKHTGVSWYKPSSRWVAHIRIDGVLKSLGYYNEELDAANAYNEALINHNKNIKR